MSDGRILKVVLDYEAEIGRDREHVVVRGVFGPDDAIPPPRNDKFRRHLARNVVSVFEGHNMGSNAFGFPAVKPDP